MEEQQLIFTFVQKFRANEDLSNEIKQIESTRYKKSVILQYYLGMYYEAHGNVIKAREQFETCVTLSPYFAPPRFHLADHHINNGNNDAAIHHMLYIFDKDTLDATVAPPRRRFQIMDQLRAISVLFPILPKKGSKNQIYYKTIINRLLKEPNWGYRHIEGWKNVHIVYAGSIQETDPEKALSLYTSGLGKDLKTYNCLSYEERSMITSLDQRLFEGFCISRSYHTNVPRCSTNIYRMYPYHNMDTIITKQCRSGKTRIGYISPDFNKNAVSLFVTPLLKHFDKDKYEIFCYYNNKNDDEFTTVLMSYPNVIWTRISEMSNQDVIYYMKNIHHIDVLLDLIGLGIGNRIELIAMKPAPIIINYLGYPDYMHMPTVDYRLVDSISDPLTHDNDLHKEQYHSGMGYCEKLLRMPRCFLCYHLFDNVALPNIRRKRTDALLPNELRCAIMNKRSKWHPIIIDAWKQILVNNPNIVLYLKVGENDDVSDVYIRELPKHQIRHIPFSEDLGSYLDFYNEIDVCLDTYPYSGTTTTCSSLVMGVPIVTIYDPKNRHVSNVTASLLKTCGEDNKYIVPSIEAYIEQVGKTACETLHEREERRARFQKAMDPIDFMREFEKTIDSIIS